MIKTNRRDFLKLGGLVGLGLLTACGPSPSTVVEEKASEVHKSKNGLLELKLVAALTNINLNGKQAKLFSYNGSLPGPRLEVQAGDTIKINFTNKLQQPTNLHFHGLHVSPSGNSDNVFLEVKPNESFDYEIKIPKNHPSGTFWYHPHYHGKVAEQLFKGLSGLIIVRGALDKIPEIAAASEHFVVLKDIELDASGNVPRSSMMELVRGREGRLLTVNGQINPKLSVVKNGLARLRFLNASSSRIYNLSIENHPMHLIATDGGAVANSQEIQNLILAPGERAEVLIKADKTSAEYKIISSSYNRFNGMAGGMMGGMMGANISGQNSTTTLARLVYEGSSQKLSIPNKISDFKLLEQKPVNTRYFNLYHRGVMGRGPRFFIDILDSSGKKIGGGLFDHKKVNVQAKLGDVEDWVISNSGSMDHPFHIHVNSFQVIDSSGKPEPAWRDIVLVKPGQSKRIRMKFEDFTGKAVYHCHILDHEDLGMMGVIEFA